MKLYARICVILVNSVLLLLFLLLLAQAVLPSLSSTYQSQMTALVGQVYSGSFDPASYFPESRPEQIGHDLDRYAVAGHWQMSDCCNLISRSYTSETMNVDANGLRQSVSPSTIHAGLPVYEVWIFGGSTAFGWGLEDRFTLAAQLQGVLQTRDQTHQIITRNYGVSSYLSTQELALFTDALRRGGRPDAVIFLDGLNDTYMRVHNATEAVLGWELETAWEAHIRTLSQPDALPWFQMNPTFPLMRLLNIHVEIATMAGLDIEREYTSLEQTERVQLAIERYQFNAAVIQSLADQYGIETYFVLQPLVALEDGAGNEIGPAFEQFYSAISVSVPGVIDMSESLDSMPDDVPRKVEYKGWHYSDYATLRLAESLADMLSN